ncbi:MAG: DNA-directed RNA polymerase subunit L [Candidatus Diapherotrites archaeon]
MKINVIKSEKDYAEFFLEGEKHSFPNLLKQKLLDNSAVEFVSYILEHPSDKNAKFVIKTKGKSPKKVLEDASKEIEKDLDEFQKSIKKTVK